MYLFAVDEAARRPSSWTFPVWRLPKAARRFSIRVRVICRALWAPRIAGCSGLRSRPAAVPHTTWSPLQGEAPNTRSPPVLWTQKHKGTFLPTLLHLTDGVLLFVTSCFLFFMLPRKPEISWNHICQARTSFNKACS